jgi:predicted DNA-binding antitoxin AbrB/MazE fold protein
MDSITVQAVYEKGVLRPRKKLNLPEHSVVEIRVRTAKPKRPSKKSLFGAYPELAMITDADIRDVKKQWNKSLQKQSRLLKRTRK